MPKNKADGNNKDNIVFQDIKNSIEENEESDNLLRPYIPLFGFAAFGTSSSTVLSRFVTFYLIL